MMISEEEISLDNLDMLAERHKGFIIRTVSTLTGRYVSVEHDDAYIIALEGFAEAAAKYDSEKGSFLSFAKLVMESRLKNYLAKETRTAAVISLDALYESGLDFEDGISEDERRLKEEIEGYRQQLAYFGLDLELLADTAPKHRDTRENAIGIAEKTSRDKQTVSLTWQKRKLPIRAVARLAEVTEKVVKTGKHFILAALIIFVKKYPGLSDWVKKAGGIQ